MTIRNLIRDLQNRVPLLHMRVYWPRHRADQFLCMADIKKSEREIQMGQSRPVASRRTGKAGSCLACQLEHVNESYMRTLIINGHD